MAGVLRWAALGMAIELGNAAVAVAQPVPVYPGLAFAAGYAAGAAQ